MDPETRTKGSRVSIWMIIYYAVAAFFFWYGIKCIVLQHGNLIVRSRWIRRSFHLLAVRGAPAVTAGWSYICLGFYWVVFPKKRAPGDFSLLVLLRILLCAACVILWLVLLMLAHKQRFGTP